VRFVITDRDAFNSTAFGLELGSALAKLFPGKMNWAGNLKLVGSRSIVERLEKSSDTAAIAVIAAHGLSEFQQKRNMFLLY
jgi:Uncharacterized protein conserved in bacteria